MTGQLALPIAPPADFDSLELADGSAWADTTDSLITIARQRRRRMWGRREAVKVLQWRLHHETRRRGAGRTAWGRPTKAQAVEIEAVAWEVAALDHLDDLDREETP